MHEEDQSLLHKGVVTLTLSLKTSHVHNVTSPELNLDTSSISNTTLIAQTATVYIAGLLQILSKRMLGVLY